MKNYFLNTKNQNIIERYIVLNPGKRWHMKFEPLFSVEEEWVGNLKGLYFETVLKF
jgi:hypothetical protein